MHDVFFAFVAGLAAGLHCLGMCGPIVLALQKPVVRERKWLGNLLYNAGRTATYGLVGLFLAFLMGRASSFFPGPAARWWISLVVNGLLVLLGVYLIVPFATTGIRLPSLAKVPGFAALARLASGRGNLAAVFLLGLLLGLLPCGLSYAMFLKSADAPHPLLGMGIGLAFGAGTAPWLLFVGVTTGYFQAGTRRWGEVLSGIVIIAMGAFNILKKFLV